MDNPIGGIRRGWPAIREGYAKLFSGPATVRVAFHDFSAQGNNDYHLFVGREKGLCETPAVRLELRIRTSRWFVKVRGAWRQLHHHGSIDEPAMLAEYQRAIFEAPVKAAGTRASEPLKQTALAGGSVVPVRRIQHDRHATTSEGHESGEPLAMHQLAVSRVRSGSKPAIPPLPYTRSSIVQLSESCQQDVPKSCYFGQPR